jgi:prepilin-type N-terminal cleavage/methylation domain-containing protein
MMQRNNRQAGFTLVEIAIVLVIIGLLLGGILKGQEMITQAKIKNVIADLNGVSAAMYSYQDRYRALPGDDKGAATRWTSTSPGNGDGIVNDGYLAAVPATLTGLTAPESVFFWHHLRLSGFLAGTGADQPFNALSGKMGVQTGDGPAAGGTPGAVLASAGPPAVAGFTALILCAANYPDKIAISVDAQLDDGIGTTGSVRGMLQTAPNPPITAAASTAVNYVETGTNQYVVCKTL